MPLPLGNLPGPRHEDLQLLKDEKIEATQISIINIGNINSTNSIMAIGTNINQISKDSIFKNIIEKIDSDIMNKEDKEELITAVKNMEKNKDDKVSFKEAYNSFLTKISTYMNIIAPFLPYLTQYFIPQ